MIELTLLASVISLAIGHWLFGRWYNPVTLYTVMWGGTMLLFLSGLIRYYGLDEETWFVIATGSFAFLIGIFTAGPWILSGRTLGSAPPVGEITVGRLSRVLWILNIVSILTVLQHWTVVAAKYGGIGRALLLGNLMYSTRVAEGIPGTIPYLGALALVACLFGGALTGLVLRPRIVAILPLITTIMFEMAHMGRAKLIMAAVLFATGFFLMHGRSMGVVAGASSRWRKLVIVVVGMAILVAGAETVRSLRGASETLTGSTRMLERVGGIGVLTPSIIMYFSVHHGVLNQYWKEEREMTPFGFNTFAPVYRILSRVSSDLPVPTYPPFYRTPIGANTGTYLREFHADFGFAGIVLGPYILGLLSAFSWRRYTLTGSFATLGALGFLLTMIVMSVFYALTRSGDMIIVLVVSMGVGRWLDRTSALLP